MGDKKIYVIAKIFDQQGCIAYRCKTVNEARCLPGTLEAIREEGVQIVVLDDPEIYTIILRMSKTLFIRLEDLIKHLRPGLQRPGNFFERNCHLHAYVRCKALRREDIYVERRICSFCRRVHGHDLSGGI